MMEKRTEIRTIIKNISSLPTLPGILTKLNALSQDGSAPVEEISRLISSDQILSAKILKLVNSPFYGFSRRVSTISNAIILLGINVAKSLVLSSSIFEIMEKNVVGLWEHSMGAGIAANVIARRLGLPDPEETATAGLLHDIGKVFIKIEMKDDYDHLISLIRDRDISILDAERELLDSDHAEIGEWLARAWMLPDKLIEPIARHHQVEKATTHRQKTAVVHLADVIVKASGFGFSGDDLVPCIQPVAWQALGLNDTILEQIVGEVEEKLMDARNFSLEIQAGDHVEA